MRVAMILVCASCLVLGAASASCSSTGNDTWSNLLVNGDFATDLSGWTASGAVVHDPNNGYPPGSAVVVNTRWALLTQTVEDSWDPALNVKEFELTAWVKIYPVEDIHFKLGYWYDTTTPPCVGEDPDVVIDLFNVTCTDGCWKQYTYHDYLPCQPRWLSVRIEWNPDLNPGADCHGWVDEVTFKARCVPEPAGLAALMTAMCAAALSRIRMKR